MYVHSVNTVLWGLGIAEKNSLPCHSKQPVTRSVYGVARCSDTKDTYPAEAVTLFNVALLSLAGNLIHRNL